MSPLIVMSPLSTIRRAIEESGLACGALNQTESCSCMDDEEIVQLFGDVDTDSSGEISYKEFIDAAQKDDLLPAWLLSNTWVKEQVDSRRASQLDESLQLRRSWIAAMNTTATITVMGSSFSNGDDSPE